MELRHLRYFLALAEERSFTRAARRLNLSQPPLSQQIRDLERELGTALFARTSRRVDLTAAGEALLEPARAILERVENARRAARESAAGLQGRIDIGLTGSVLLGPLPELLAAYRRQAPGVRVFLQEMAPALQLSALAERRLDLCFARGGALGDAMASLPAWRETVLVAMPRGHRLARRRRLRLAELHAEEFVLLKRGSSAFADHLVDCCAQAGFAPRVSQEVLDAQTLPRLVESGFGIALIPASVENPAREGVAYRPLERGGPVADVHLVHRAQETTPAVLAFLEHARRWFAEHRSWERRGAQRGQAAALC